MKIGEVLKLTWKKNWSGPWSFLECCYYGRGYTSVLKKKYGIGLDSALFISHSGTSSNFLDERDLRVFGERMAKKIEQDISIAYAWSDTAKKQGDRALALMKLIKGKGITQADYEALWEILFAYLSVNFPIKRVGDYLNGDILGKLLPTFEEIRISGEPVYAQAAILTKKFADQLSQKIALTPSQVLSMTNREIAQYFDSNRLPPKEILDARYENSVLVVHKGREAVFVGDDAKSIEAVITARSSRNEIRGSVAYKGKVCGKVRIIFDPQQISSFGEPTVLVTEMTRPEYLHLFKEAVGVVTDAGGILSHAAITARELKKPTIIGTEIATKVLKDGDLVEVDANTGVVRKL